MKNIILVFLFCGGLIAVNGQTRQPTNADQILKDLFDENKTSAEASANDNSSGPLEHIEIYRDWFMTSLEGWLMILTPENNSSLRKSEDIKFLPAMRVGKSIVSIASLLDDMDLEIKNDKLKSNLMAINYLTGKEKKLSSMKILYDEIYRPFGTVSEITKEAFNPKNNSILVYLEGSSYHSMAYSNDEDIEENTSRIPGGVSGFLIQRNLETDEYKYSLVGVYNGRSKEMILFGSAKIEMMKKI